MSHQRAHGSLWQPPSSVLIAVLGLPCCPRRLPSRALVMLVVVLLCGCWHGPAGVLGSVPADLTNFQNEYPCDPNATLIVRPLTLDDVAEAVRQHDYIMTNGEGHSWNQPFFCVQPGAPLNTSEAQAANTTSSTAAAAADGSSTPKAAAAGQPASVLPIQSGHHRRLSQQVLQIAIPLTNSNRSSSGSSSASNTSSATDSAATANPSSSNSSSSSSKTRSYYIPAPAVLPQPSAANIVMTTLRPLNISVNESAEYVWVDAGVKTIDLLDYLKNYVSPAAPAGWTLGAFPWFVYQSIAGAVATNTHGSSLTHKSLSNQVLAFDVILANGTRRTFTNESDPFLMKAWRVSVGKLGIIARVKLQIFREVPVQRSLKTLTPPQFITLLQFMMVSYTRSDDTAAASSAAQLSSILANFKPDNTTVFTRKGDLVALGELVLPADAAININASQIIVTAPADSGTSTTTATNSSNNSSSMGPADTAAYSRAQQWLQGFLGGVINEPVAAAAGDAAEARTKGSRWMIPKPKLMSSFYGAANMAEGLMEVSRLGIMTIAGNSTAEPSSIYIHQPASTLPQLQATLYDQYEASIPISAMATCWSKLLDVVYQGDLLGQDKAKRSTDKGFRTSPLIRFIGQEDGLLSLTHDGPRMFVNIEDYLFYNRNRRVNERFREVMAVLTGDPACTSKGPPRLHWGKAGWPDPGCFRGEEHFGDNWCHFGCAMRALDPSGKFADSSRDVWTWSGVDLSEQCCGPAGFKSGQPGCECKVQHARSASDCPPAPFYTTR